MAIVFMEGFDFYNSSQGLLGAASRWTFTTTSTGLITVSAGRFGGQRLYLDGQDGKIEAAWPTPISQGSFGFAYNCNLGGQNGATPTFSVLTGGTQQCGVNVRSDGLIAAMRGTTQVVNSVVPVIQLNTWHYIELEFEIADVGGRLTVYVDGAQVCTFSGDTANSGTTANGVFMNSGASGFGRLGYYDDIYISDSSTRLGECRIETLRPSADASPLTLTPNSGAVHYDRVNATVAQSVTYNQGVAVGLEDRYDLSNLSSIPATVHAIQLGVVANKTDANAKAIALSADDGTTVYYSGQIPLGASATILNNTNRKLLNTNPSGGAWTGAIVNALKAGVRIDV